MSSLCGLVSVRSESICFSFSSFKLGFKVCGVQETRAREVRHDSEVLNDFKRFEEMALVGPAGTVVVVLTSMTDNREKK